MLHCMVSSSRFTSSAENGDEKCNSSSDGKQLSVEIPMIEPRTIFVHHHLGIISLPVLDLRFADRFGRGGGGSGGWLQLFT